MRKRMKTRMIGSVAMVLLGAALVARAEEKIEYEAHDGRRPQPAVITPGTFSTPEQPGKPPSDAVVLFDGKDLSKWESVKDAAPAAWKVVDGCIECVPRSGYIQTKEKFGDVQLHIEWME